MILILALLPLTTLLCLSRLFLCSQIKPVVAALTGPTIWASNTPLPSSSGTLVAMVSSCRPIRSSPLPPRPGWPWNTSWSTSVTTLIDDYCITTDGESTIIRYSTLINDIWFQDWLNKMTYTVSASVFYT